MNGQLMNENPYRHALDSAFADLETIREQINQLCLMRERIQKAIEVLKPIVSMNEKPALAPKPQSAPMSKPVELPVSTEALFAKEPVHGADGEDAMQRHLNQVRPVAATA